MALGWAGSSLLVTSMMFWSPSRSGFGFLGVAFSLTLVSLVIIAPSERSCHVSWEQEIMPQTFLLRPTYVLPPLTWVFFHVRLLSCSVPPRVEGAPSFSQGPHSQSLFSFLSDYSLQQTISFRNARKESDTHISRFSCRVPFITPRGAGRWTCIALQLREHPAREGALGVHLCRQPGSYTYSPGASSLSLVGGWKWTQGHTI